MPRISVAMAVYNGEKYIREQIDSILSQLNEDDELVISYDSSSDRTLDIIEGIYSVDRRVAIVMNTLNGVKENFNNALAHCSGDYIFISDQDDIWEDNKIADVLAIFQSTTAELVIHNGIHVDETLKAVSESFFDISRVKPGIFMNFLSPQYSGCCMALTSKLKEIILPFPRGNITYDHWIGMIGELRGKVFFFDKILIRHRLHGGNVTTPRRKLHVVLKYRICLLIALLKRL